MARLLIPGSRNGWDTDNLKHQLLGALIVLASGEGTVLIHGDAPGVDTQAADIWKGWGLPVEAHPADWSIGKKAGPLRNQEMVDLGADLCLAFVAPESRGTRDCLRRAEEAGIPVEVFYS